MCTLPSLGIQDTRDLMTWKITLMVDPPGWVTVLRTVVTLHGKVGAHPTVGG